MNTSAEFMKHFPDFTWNHKPDQILERAKLLKETTANIYDKVVGVSSENVNFESVLEPVALDEAFQSRIQNMIYFYESVSIDKEIRDASTAATKMLSDFGVELSMRKDVYDILKIVQTKEVNLTGERLRLLDKLLLIKKRNGLHLDKEVRDHIEVLDKRISNLCLDFQKNCGEENSSFLFTKNELDGMHEDFINSLDKNGEQYVVTLKYPHVLPLLKMCKVPETRQKIEKEFNSRCIDSNVQILEELIGLRDKRAKILGYLTHADYVTEILMSKKSENVHHFLLSLADKLKEKGRVELNRLLELKKEECTKLGLKFDGKINSWDNGYYQRMVEERDFNVDHNVIREYFPFEHVTEKLLEIYQELLHLSFMKVSDSVTWHPEVELYAVLDSHDNNKLLGYFYLDLFPRPGKYGHAACFPLQEACMGKDGYQLPLAAMVTNFTKPLPDKPSLLTHDEVKVYFHEFGHVMHHICSKAHYCMFSGTSVERDFVEAPSQMLENWVWNQDSLRRISCHYKTKEKLSDELIDKLCNSRKANIALFCLRQIALSLFDYSIHVASTANTFEVWRSLFLEYVGIEITPGTNFSSSFGHMCGGYDSRYYGYLWSQVYSCDMFLTRFKSEGVFNPNTGLSYRQKILQPGSSKDASDILHSFLGRDPIQEPFLEIIGIKSD